MGLVSFSGWFLVVNRSSISAVWKYLFEGLCVLGFVVALSAPVVLGVSRFIDSVGAFLLWGALWSFAVFIAERCGVNLFASGTAASEPAHASSSE